MRRITAIEQLANKRGQYLLYINGEPDITVHEDSIVRHRLIKGTELDESTYHRIQEEQMATAAYVSALNMLSHQMRTKKELRTKLTAKGYSNDAIDQVLERLAQEKYVNDEQYAHLFTKQRLQHQKKGSLWIRQELKMKGITEEQISSSLEQLDDSLEFEQALQFARSKWERMKEDTLTKHRKLYAMLIRRGFPNSIVRRVMNTVNSESIYDDND